MPSRNPDPHGNAPDKSAVALLLIDMINDFEFEGGDALLKHAAAAAQAMEGMLKIWGRNNSVNVQKVLWCCEELRL